MKRAFRILAILAILACVGAATTWRISSTTEQPAAPSLIEAGDSRMDPALYRYRQDMPRHWRDVMFGW